MPEDERERLLADVVEQLAEMSELVAELVALDTAPRRARDAREDVRLDLLAGEAVERARRNRAGVTFTPDLEESVVSGIPGSIERAIDNLLDNAAKWSPPGGDVEVSVHGGEVAVRDHGPGIDERRPPVRLRPLLPGARRRAAFRLRARARDRPPGRRGHGGEVVAERADGGGTRVRLRFPPGWEWRFGAREHRVANRPIPRYNAVSDQAVSARVALRGDRSSCYSYRSRRCTADSACFLVARPCLEGGLRPWLPRSLRALRAKVFLV